MVMYSCRLCVFCFKQKTAYEMRISDWSSDVCSSDLARERGHAPRRFEPDGRFGTVDAFRGDRPDGGGDHAARGVEATRLGRYRERRRMLPPDVDAIGRARCTGAVVTALDRLIIAEGVGIVHTHGYGAEGRWTRDGFW